MRKKILYFIISLAILTVFSCKSGAEKTGTQENTEQTEVFDPTKITQAQYNTTREEVQKFIEQQNKIIKDQNFDAWKTSLSPEYFAGISSTEYLSQMSEQPAMKTRRIVLKTVQDYFEYVVVPSRADLRVDEIEFISLNRVKAFTVITSKSGEEQRLRLYDLEKIGNSWTIIN
jgi:hypothetical protein